MVSAILLSSSLCSRGILWLPLHFGIRPHRDRARLDIPEVRESQADRFGQRSWLAESHAGPLDKGAQWSAFPGSPTLRTTHGWPPSRGTTERLDRTATCLPASSDRRIEGSPPALELRSDNPRLCDMALETVPWRRILKIERINGFPWPVVAVNGRVATGSPRARSPTRPPSAWPSRLVGAVNWVAFLVRSEH